MYDPDDYEYEESDESKINDAELDLQGIVLLKASAHKLLAAIDATTCLDEKETKEAHNYLHDFINDTLNWYIVKRQKTILDLSGDENEEHRLTKTDLV